MKQCPNDPNHSEFLTPATETHTWRVDGNGNFLADLGCDEVFAGPDKANTWVCAECSAEAVEAAEPAPQGAPLTVSILDGTAVLAAGTEIRLTPIQEYMAGCFKTTGYKPYADMADSLTLLTNIDWREQ